MIPALVNLNGAWKVLPPGVHDATLEEIGQGFATNARRRELFDGLVRAVKNLRSAGCKAIYLDGSFVTEKLHPGDFDVCWDPTNVDPKRLHPVMLDFSNNRSNQKHEFGGEFFPSSARADHTQSFIEFFQTDKYTGKKKGIVRILLARTKSK